jgi:hypothetical protein
MAEWTDRKSEGRDTQKMTPTSYVQAGPKADQRGAVENALSAALLE